MSDQTSTNSSSLARGPSLRWLKDASPKRTPPSDNQNGPSGSGSDGGSGGKKADGTNGVRPSRGLFTIVTAIMLGAMLFLIVTTIPQAKPVGDWSEFVSMYEKKELKERVEIHDDGIYATKIASDGQEQQGFHAMAVEAELVVLHLASRQGKVRERAGNRPHCLAANLGKGTLQEHHGHHRHQ